MVTEIHGKDKTKLGLSPAVLLINPKEPRNVGACVRAASCFGFKQVWYTGNRVSLTPTKKYRLPREERMKGYAEVELRQFDYPFEQFEKDVVTVAIEVRENAENLIEFEHPEKALYVFGPEDGGLERVVTQHCHRFVIIPARHCTNLAAAVYITLYDRYAKRVKAGLEELYNVGENEDRGYSECSVVG